MQLTVKWIVACVLALLSGVTVFAQGRDSACTPSVSYTHLTLPTKA